MKLAGVNTGMLININVKILQIGISMIFFVLFVSFMVRTMGWGKEVNHKSMLHRGEPKKKASLSLHGGRTMKPTIKIYTLLYI
jgi:hypothetical protein